jgi:hypothetical protein
MTQITTAWNLIGTEDHVRIVGGRTVYEAVEYNDKRSGKLVRLARITNRDDGLLRQINRYVDPDTLMEVLS